MLRNSPSGHKPFLRRPSQGFTDTCRVSLWNLMGLSPTDKKMPCHQAPATQEQASAWGGSREEAVCAWVGLRLCPWALCPGSSKWSATLPTIKTMFMTCLEFYSLPSQHRGNQWSYLHWEWGMEEEVEGRKVQCSEAEPEARIWVKSEFSATILKIGYVS